MTDGHISPRPGPCCTDKAYLPAISPVHPTIQFMSIRSWYRPANSRSCFINASCNPRNSQLYWTGWRDSRSGCSKWLLQVWLRGVPTVLRLTWPANFAENRIKSEWAGRRIPLVFRQVCKRALPMAVAHYAAKIGEYELDNNP